MKQIFAYLWPAPYTVFGIAVGLLLGCRFRRVQGVVEIHGPLLAMVLQNLPVPALAMTMGHVVQGDLLAYLECLIDKYSGVPHDQWQRAVSTRMAKPRSVRL